MPLRFMVAPVPTFSVADAAGDAAKAPPMLAVPLVVNVARLPLIDTVPMLFRFSPTSRPKAVTLPLARMFNVPVPLLPTRSGVLVIVQVEPEPATVAVPAPPLLIPRPAPKEVARAAPF